MAGELRGWKEIAAYLGVTDRTAQRWESELNLPVHRLRQHGASPVYAILQELDDWRRSADGALAAAQQTSRPAVTAAEARQSSDALAPADVEGKTATKTPWKRVFLVLALAAVAIIAVAVALLVRTLSEAPPAKTPAAAPKRPASDEAYAHTSSDSPFVITMEIAGSDEAWFRARSHGGQMIYITLPSGAKFGLAPAQAGGSVRVGVIELTRGGRGAKVLETLLLARGVSHRFTRGADSFRFAWISSDPIPEGTEWASRQLQGCGFSCSSGRAPYDRSPAMFVEADEVTSSCGTCCDPEFGACSQRKNRRP